MDVMFVCILELYNFVVLNGLYPFCIKEYKSNFEIVTYEIE